MVAAPTFAWPPLEAGPAVAPTTRWGSTVSSGNEDESASFPLDIFNTLLERVQTENYLTWWPPRPGPTQPEPQQCSPHCPPKHMPWASRMGKPLPLHTENPPEGGLYARTSALEPFPNFAPQW